MRGNEEPRAKPFALICSAVNLQGEPGRFVAEEFFNGVTQCGGLFLKAFNVDKVLGKRD